MMYDCVRLLFTWFCTILQIYTLHNFHNTACCAACAADGAHRVHRAIGDQLMHGCLLVQTKKQKTAHSAVRLRPNEHWQTQMVFGLFFRWTFIGLFVCFCLQSCFVFRRQSSKGGSTSGVVKGGLSHHDA